MFLIKDKILLKILLSIIGQSHWIKIEPIIEVLGANVEQELPEQETHFLLTRYCS